MEVSHGVLLIVPKLFEIFKAEQSYRICFRFLGAIQDDDDLDVSCAVRGCGMTKEENPSLLFFPVPRNDSERRKWLLQIGMLDGTSESNTNSVLAVCELHFDVS